MKINKWLVVPEDVKAGKQIGTPLLRVDNPCPCGCSPSPFVSLSDGETGMTVCFDSQQELEQFKQDVLSLELPENHV